jgi:uncharacterized protein YqjF (DUF2071 family)
MPVTNVPVKDMSSPVFDRAMLKEVAHRPWPTPDAPWVMTQTRHDLLFAHWPVSAGVLREKVPPQFELDLFDGSGWLGVVPFRMTNVAYFLTERYCLYQQHHSGVPYRLEIHHPPWLLQPAEAELTRNTMADAAGLSVPAMKPLLHFSKRQDIAAWAPWKLPRVGD